MAFIQSVLMGTTDPIWVAVESEFGSPGKFLSEGEIEGVVDSVRALQNRLKREGDRIIQESEKKKPKTTQKSVRFDVSAFHDTRSADTPFELSSQT
jgi:hypothetical protein